MSWSEVKKINSDLSVPLDERAKYVAGIIPRSLNVKTLSGSVSNSFLNDGSFPKTKESTISEVTGSGLVTSIFVNIPKSDGNVGNVYAELEIELDDRSIIVRTDVIAYTQNTSTSRTMSLNLDNITGLSKGVKVITSNVVMNEPIKFSNHLKLKLKIVNTAWYSSSMSSYNFGSANVSVGVIILE